MVKVMVVINLEVTFQCCCSPRADLRVLESDSQL